MLIDRQNKKQKKEVTQQMNKPIYFVYKNQKKT